MPAGWVAAAGAVASLASGVIGSSNAKKASKRQLKATRESNALQRYLFEQSQSDLAPYRQTGYGALNQMNRVMGLPQVNTDIEQWNYDGKQGVYSDRSRPMGAGYGVLGGQLPPETTAYLESMGYGPPQQQQTMPVEQDRYGGFYASPGYQFAYDESMKGAERAASAGGYIPTANGGRSGRFSKEMARYSQGLASQEFGNYFNRLGVLSGIGQTATSEGIAAGQTYGVNASNAILAGGDARASGIIGSGNAWSGAIEGVASAFGDYMRSRQNQGKT